jgi:hypothetical protein
MKDSANIVITFLLVLPWLARAVVSTMAVWRAHTESPNQENALPCFTGAEEAHEL